MLNILYICTHNRCRSILSEVITNSISQEKGQGKLFAKSAGSTPAGEVHPLTLQYLNEAGYPIDGLTSNSWDDADYMQDFTPDIVITVCDNAQGESCPIWLGNTPKLHWGLADPSKNTDDEAVTKTNFQAVIAIIENRVGDMLAILDNDNADLPKDELIRKLQALVNNN